MLVRASLVSGRLPQVIVCGVSEGRLASLLAAV